MLQEQEQAQFEDEEEFGSTDDYLGLFPCLSAFSLNGSSNSSSPHYQFFLVIFLLSMTTYSTTQINTML
jgi:hypothetical protein